MRQLGHGSLERGQPIHVNAPLMDLYEHESRDCTCQGWVLLAGADQQAAGGHVRTLCQIGPESTAASKVALGPDQPFGADLEIPRVASGRRIVVDDEHRVLHDEGSPLEAVGGRTPGAREVLAVERAIVREKECGQRALQRPRLALQPDGDIGGQGGA
jgi:hypothetical protein